jgi:hypothetical protein
LPTKRSSLVAAADALHLFEQGAVIGRRAARAAFSAQVRQRMPRGEITCRRSQGERTRRGVDVSGDIAHMKMMSWLA